MKKQRYSIFVFYFLMLYHALVLAQGECLITEIIYALPGSDSPNEYVELFNPSEMDTLDLNGWSIRDRSSTDALIDSGYGLKVPPLSYAVILEGDYPVNSGIYLGLIPENTILVKVDDSSIGNGLSSSDSLYILDSADQVIETLGWEDWSDDGFSLERIRLHLFNSPANWTQSIDSLGTPGMSNSVLPDSIDFAVTHLALTPSIVGPHQTITLNGQIANVGLHAAEPQIQVLVDGSFYTQEYPGIIQELDTAGFELEIGPFISGFHTILAVLNTEEDTNDINDQASVMLGVRYEEQSIVLNEFIPRPAAGFPEFVELVNIGDAAIDLLGWRVTDSHTGENYSLNSAAIDSGGYVVVAADSTLLDSVPDLVPYLVPAGGFPSLNNSGDQIRIFDPFETLIDSLEYTTTWEIMQGVSFEKFYTNDGSAIPENWAHSTAPSGFTPGAPNSVTPAVINGALLPEAIIYQPEIPGQEDQITMTVPVLNRGTAVFQGIVTVAYNENILDQNAFISGNLNDTSLVELNLGSLPPGSHVLAVILEVENDPSLQDNSAADTLRIHFSFGSVLFNEFMAAPNNDQSEFVELVAFADLTLEGWGIADNHRTPVILGTFHLQTGEYAIVAADSIIIESVPEGIDFIVPLNSWPNLNNSGDMIYLFDHTATIIDSLYYDSSWPVEGEQSTEKLRPDFLSDVAENWLSAKENLSMTPGYPNSVMILDTDGALVRDSITYLPIPAAPDSEITLQVPVANTGMTSISGSISIEWHEEEIGTGSFSALAAGDTAVVYCPLISVLPSGGHTVFCILDVVYDANPENDIAAVEIAVRYPFGAVLINEFFHLPDSAESEFVELVSLEQVNLDHWMIMDESGSKGYLPDYDIDPYNYIIITRDTSMVETVPQESVILFPLPGLPGLNNLEETIYILDHTASIVDSLQYNDTWPMTQSRSTEKYRLSAVSNHSGNWGISVAGAGRTPGAENSLYFSSLPEKGQLNFTPNPFSPDGNGIDDFLTLEYALPFERAVVRWEVLDMSGRVIARPVYHIHAGQNGRLTWDGKQDNGASARIGIYVMKVSFKDESSSRLWESVQTVILAKPL